MTSRYGMPGFTFEDKESTGWWWWWWAGWDGNSLSSNIIRVSCVLSKVLPAGDVPRNKTNETILGKSIR